MCGIAGVLDLKNRRVSQSQIAKMTKSLAHRGPNDEGVFVDGQVALGHRRLSILDLSSSGHQPMLGRKDRVAIVFNGEIYNYIEIKRELDNKSYKSSSDTEVILKAYDKWGVKALDKFNGIFSFALWDKSKKRLFCARDRLGVKPFYYAVQNGVFYFASEIKSLLVAGVKAKPNNEIIYDYLAHGYYEHSEETFFAGIKQLMPGHMLEIQNSKIKIQKYWHLPDKVKDLSNLSDSQVSEAYDELVTKSVKIQMRSDVPIGINVSGGLDSSILTEVVDRISKGQKNFRLFSWTYDEKQYDERPYVAKLAKHLGWQADFFRLTPKLTLGLLPKVILHEEQPFPGISIVARHNLYRQADKNIIVFLEGHGGDEIGGGYEYYFSSFILDAIRDKGPDYALRELSQYAKQHNLSSEESVRFFANGIRSSLIGGTSADASEFISRHCLGVDFMSDYAKPRPVFDRPFKSFLSNMQYRDVSWTKLPRVLRSVDRNSMAYGREVRVPFLDHNIVEFAFSLPIDQRIRNGEQRFFMREAFRKRLAPHNVNAPKRAVPDPQRRWLQKDMSEWVEDMLTSRSFRQRDYFDSKKVLDEYRSYKKRKDNLNSFHIWQWLNLELWLQTFIDRKLEIN
ncbi:MAG: asparagine synthase (glutamine-hydrolyzing) [bacterium]|nr:asparagine synthase (glutamine-hydrolyzing) [bacterium]